MAYIKVLVQGYAKETPKVDYASSTATLIQDKGINIIVDPGMDKKRLLSGLRNEKLTTKDINYVILTHTHIDHCILTALFENAIILDNDCSYNFKGEIRGHEGKVPGTNIKIIKTPGHDPFHCSVIADTKEFGKVAIVGDVFWWSDGENQERTKEDLIARQDQYVKNEKELMDSRRRVLETADYIIPGHGKMFKSLR